MWNLEFWQLFQVFRVRSSNNDHQLYGRVVVKVKIKFSDTHNTLHGTKNCFTEKKCVKTTAKGRGEGEAIHVPLPVCPMPLLDLQSCSFGFLVVIRIFKFQMDAWWKKVKCFCWKIGHSSNLKWSKWETLCNCEVELVNWSLLLDVGQAAIHAYKCKDTRNWV